MDMAAFVLASASPRRRELLAQVGLEPEVMPSHIDETPREGESAEAYGLRVATEKARACADERPALAADTEVVLDGRCLGKPGTAEAAKAMLRSLSGRSHEVLTAVALRTGQDVLTAVVRTEVSFRDLSDEEIARYVATGECADKAGAYGIQGRGGALVARVSGSYTNVVGLPLEETLALLAKGGLP